MGDRLISVVTTIQEPTASLRKLVQSLQPVGGKLIVVGDKKGPARFELDEARFVSLAQQMELPFKLARLLPTGNYARKNLGYLLAFAEADSIYETDDDNAPNAHWMPRPCRTQVQVVEGPEWRNVYRLFSTSKLWPRGFPISRLAQQEAAPNGALVEVEAPIQQGLADGSPDVDAIWRLVLDEPITFDRRPSVMLSPGTWCPFNSQTTWWWAPAWPLMYLPSCCSMRMTDIWRSFIAQRCLWELDCGLVFHAAEVDQERNVHNLMRDFEDEVPGYLGNERLVATLAELSLQKGPQKVVDNLLACYRCLIAGGFFPDKELPLVEAWLEDLPSV